MNILVRRAFAWSACASFALHVSLSFSASIHYGDFGPDYPPGVTMYLDVEESSGTDPVPPARYGAPALSGDVLHFKPTQFVASATGGQSDITDGQLNFRMMILQHPDMVAGGMTTLQVSEAGDYSLFGGGTAATAVAAGVSASVKILAVDGAPIAPINLFASNSIVRDLVSDGPVVLAPWSNGLLIEFGPVLAANNIDFKYGVTKAEVAINDQLLATSEPNSIAFIAKKDFVIEPGIKPNGDFTWENVPEPASAAMLISLVGWVWLRRQRNY